MFRPTNMLVASPVLTVTPGIYNKKGDFHHQWTTYSTLTLICNLNFFLKKTLFRQGVVHSSAVKAVRVHAFTESDCFH